MHLIRALPSTETNATKLPRSSDTEESVTINFQRRYWMPTKRLLLNTKIYIRNLYDNRLRKKASHNYIGSKKLESPSVRSARALYSVKFHFLPSNVREIETVISRCMWDEELSVYAMSSSGKNNSSQ